MEHASDLGAIRENVEQLSVKEQMEEFMFLGLRKIEGVSISEFENAFARSMEECYGKQIRVLIEQGLLRLKDGRLKLTKRGVDVSNYVFSEFLQ